MRWTGESIAALLQAVLEHRPGRFELEHDGLRIVVERDADPSRLAVAGSAASAATPAGGSGTSGPAPRDAAGLLGALAPGEIVIAAPTVGVFYRRPEPAAAPFVEVGSEVAAGATVGLVEVMKMFSAVTAPVAGRVVRILAADADAVTLGQPLLVLAGEA